MSEKTQLQKTEIQKNEIDKSNLSPSVRFMNKIIKECSYNNGEVRLTEFQKKLCQNYFIKIDQILKETEKRRLATKEGKRSPLPCTWDNVNMEKLSNDIVSFSSVELDPSQPNHLSIIPYCIGDKKYDITLMIGYKGIELKAKKYGLEIPDDIVVELVYSTDIFKQIKKDFNNSIESYEFEVVNNFNRGDVVGGFWYHSYKKNPEKNKIKVFSVVDIIKRKPKYAAAEFWGGEKNVWENGKVIGVEKVEGWFDEMAYKTICKSAYSAITIDSKKIDDNYIMILNAESESHQYLLQHNISMNANKEELSFDDAEVVEEEQVNENTTESISVEDSVSEKKEVGQQIKAPF